MTPKKTMMELMQAKKVAVYHSPDKPFHKYTNDELEAAIRQHSDSASELRRFDRKSHAAYQHIQHAYSAKEILKSRKRTERGMDESVKRIKVSVTKPIGYKIADIGPGRKESNVKRMGPGSDKLDEAKHTVYKLHGVSQSYDPQTEKWTSDHTEQEVLASSRRHALNKTLKKLQTLHPHHKEHEVTIQESDLKAKWNADSTKDSYARRKNLRRTIQQQLVPKTPGLGNRAWLRADKEEKKNRSSVYSVHESATTSSSGMSFDDAIAHATKHGGKIVFGTNSQKWHSISPQDRDYNMSHASDPQDAKRVGEKQAKWGVRSVARSVINRKTVQEAFQAAKNKNGSKVKSADFDTPKDLKSKGDQDPGQDEVQSKPPQFGSKDQENPQDAPDQKPKNNAPKPEKKGTKLVVKGPGPDDAFQKDPMFTPVSTLVAAAGVR